MGVLKDSYSMVKKRENSVREEDRHVGTILRVIEILECFKFRKPELTLTELSRLTGLQKSRLLRLCGTLVFKGYLDRDNETLKFRLGPRLMVLGRIYESANELSKMARPIVKKLAEETKETASLFVVHGTHRLCLVKEDGDFPIRYVNVEGDILHLHRGVGGKVLLGFAADDEREELLKKFIDDPEIPLAQDNVDEYRRELLNIREKGYIIAYGDVIPDVGSIAAPVFDYTGKCRASIAVAGPVHRFMADRHPILIKRLLDATSRLSSRLGYEPDDHFRS